MSKKKRKAVKPMPEPVRTHTVTLRPRHDESAPSFFRMLMGPYSMSLTFGGTGTSLREAVSSQLADLGIVDEPGPAELPTPPDWDRFDVAHESAIRRCDHSRASTSRVFSTGERQCDDCGRYFTRHAWWDQ